MRRIALLCLAAAGLMTTPRTVGALSSQATPRVRQLHVAILVYPRSFAHTMTRAEMERLQEEVVEFADFYRRHGGDRVDFRFTYVRVDRELRREEVGEVAPGRYYLSREDVEAELVALGVDTMGVDEVVAFYAWSNANPQDAALAYGGGAVGPDGNFLARADGDAGFNSIGVFAWDPGRIAQIAVHEVLHNVDDMFSRSGMADAFFNSDEMSRNMATLIAERPGAFLPHYTDAEMRAYAEREAAGKEMYPWWMQAIYYAWMLERTPAEDWAALDYGRMTAAPEEGPRPLYSTVVLPAAAAEMYYPVLGGMGDGGTLTARGSAGGASAVALDPRRWALEDFDGDTIVAGPYDAGWLRLVRGDDRIVLDRGSGGPVASTRVVRYRLAGLRAPERVVAYGDEGAELRARLVTAAWPDGGEPVPGARVTAAAGDRSLELRHEGDGVYAAAVPSGSGAVSWRIGAEREGWHIPPATVTVERRADWSVRAPAELEASMATPLNLRVDVVRDRSIQDARVTARVAGRDLPLEPLAEGGHAVDLDGLPPGLHEVVIRARRPDGSEAVDTVRVLARASGWIRVPRRLEVEAGRAFDLEASVRSRMGDRVEGYGLPIVAIRGATAVPLAEVEPGVYRGTVPALPAGQHRVYVTSLEGDFQRRVIVVRAR